MSLAGLRMAAGLRSGQPFGEVAGNPALVFRTVIPLLPSHDSFGLPPSGSAFARSTRDRACQSGIGFLRRFALVSNSVMRDSKGFELAEDLVRKAQNAGFLVTTAQIARWNRVGLLPKPRQHGLGQGPGSETR